MMRVLYLTRSYSPHDHRFLRALAATEHQVLYLGLEEPADAETAGSLPPGIQALAWRRPIRRMRWSHVPGRRRELRRILDEARPDVIHAGPIQHGALLAGMAGAAPLVSMSWGSDLLRDARKGPGRWAASWALRKSTVLVCDCEAVRRAAIDLGMPADRIVVFPWGVDLAHFSPGEDGGLRERLGWGQAFVLLSTRSWEPVYGVDLLLHAFRAAAPAHPELRLLMLGDGSMREWVRSFASMPELRGRIHFAGRVPLGELPAYYRAANVYCSASRSDGSSVSLMEALACGLPALVSDIPANREWVTPGENGWWFSDGQEDSLRQVIGSVILDRQARPAMAEAARVRAVARADWGVNFGQLLRAYALAVRLQPVSHGRRRHAHS